MTPLVSSTTTPPRVPPRQQIEEIDRLLSAGSAALSKLDRHDHTEIQKAKADLDRLLDRRLDAMKLRDRRGRLTRQVHSQPADPATITPPQP